MHDFEVGSYNDREQTAKREFYENSGRQFRGSKKNHFILLERDRGNNVWSFLNNPSFLASSDEARTSLVCHAPFAVSND